MLNAFAEGGSDLNKMLDKQMSGLIDSWAVRWFYNQFKIQALTLYPVYSKVYYNGFDSFATHTTGSNKRYIPKTEEILAYDFNFPEEVKPDKYYQKKFQHKMGVVSRVRSRIESLFLK